MKIGFDRIFHCGRDILCTLQVNIPGNITYSFSDLTCTEDTIRVKICITHPIYTELIFNKRNGVYQTICNKVTYELDNLDTSIQFHVEYLDMTTQLFKVTTNCNCICRVSGMIFTDN
jgi:hypothetical protein